MVSCTATACREESLERTVAFASLVTALAVAWADASEPRAFARAVLDPDGVAWSAAQDGGRPRVVDALDALLAGFVRAGRVDYGALAADRAPLDRTLTAIAAVTAQEFDGWDRARKVAYLINAYNAYAVATVVEHRNVRRGFFTRPLRSIREIPGVFSGIRHRVAGRALTLDDIEHDWLRERLHEPRVHFALVCAAVSCPELRPEAYRADRLDEQLDDQVRRFVRDPSKLRIDREAERVHLSKILDWYGEDFRRFAPESSFVDGDPNVRGVLAFIRGYLPEEEARDLEAGGYRVRFFGYDWSLNDTTLAR